MAHGLVVDLLVGNALSGIGVESLRKIRSHLNDDTRLLLIEALQRQENEREPFADIYARDQEWERVVENEEERLDHAFQELLASDTCGLSVEEQEEILQRTQEFIDLPESEKQDFQVSLDLQSLAMPRLLSVDVALRSWASADVLPKSLAALVPRYLKELPLDPFTGEDFIYRRLPDRKFVLYSTGPKRVDGRGKFGPWSSVTTGCADLCLDVEDFCEC